MEETTQSSRGNPEDASGTPGGAKSAASQPQKGKNTGMAVIAYIIFFVPLLTEAKNDPFVKYHIKQGLVLFLCAVVVWFVVQVIPVIGWIISPLLNIVILVLMIIGIINAVNGTQKPLPLVGSFADNFKF